VGFVPPSETHGPADGPAVLLIAPLGRDRNSWSIQLPDFAADLRCTVYDARGTGVGAQPVHRTSVEEMAADAVSLLAELQLDQAHIAGWSLGAAVATAVALAAPDRVRSLSLYTPWGRTDQWLTQCFRFLREIARTGTLTAYEATVTWLLLSRDMINSIDDFDANVAATVASPGYPAAVTLIAQLEASIEHDLLDEAAAISCPTLVVAGERDQLVPAEYARDLAAKIPAARLEVLTGPGSTHGLLVERPSDFNTLAVDFIKEVDGAL
jgi:pimeloyl-ACP methyl ester carboxylesterase